MVFNASLLINIGTVFDQRDFGILFLLQLGRASVIPRFACLAECKSRIGHRGQSSDCSLLQDLHTPLGAIRALCSRSEDCVAKLGSVVCAYCRTTSGLSDSHFPHNTSVMMVKKKLILLIHIIKRRYYIDLNHLKSVPINSVHAAYHMMCMKLSSMV